MVYFVVNDAVYATDKKFYKTIQKSINNNTLTKKDFFQMVDDGVVKDVYEDSAKIRNVFNL